MIRGRINRNGAVCLYSSRTLQAQPVIKNVLLPLKSGCTNPLAVNFDKTARVDDGSCIVLPATGSMFITSDNPTAITDIFGLGAIDASVNHRRATDPTFINAISALQNVYIEPVIDATVLWVRYVAVGSDGYNIVLSEVSARGKNIATLLSGVGNRTYGYGFFEDALAYMIQLSPIPEIVVSFDLVRPVLNGTYTPTYAEIDYVVSACATAGITIRCFQLCYEMGLKDNNDVFTAASDISTATQIVATYIHNTYPTIKISSDATLWDDGAVNYPTLNSLLNAVPYIDYARQYFQFPATLTTYESNRARIQQLPMMLDFFKAKFTNGQKLRIVQSIIKPGNPLMLKVGEGLIYSELIMNLITRNIQYSGLIQDYVNYSVSRLISGTNTIYPAYDFMVLMRGAMGNNGKIDIIFSDSAFDILVSLSVKNGSESETYIINPTGMATTIDAVYLDGVQKNVSVDSYYGNPYFNSASHYTNSGTSVLLQPYSLSKIVTS